MRKKAKYILASLLMFCFTTSVKAEECSYEKQVELNNIAATVKATYEETKIDTGLKTHPVDPATGEIDPNKEEPYYEDGFKVKILNITENIYVRVADTSKTTSYYDEDGDLIEDEKETYYYYEDTDKGTLTLDTISADTIHTYEIEIYDLAEDCSIGELRKITFRTPMYNSYSSLGACVENPEFEYCKKYISQPLNITLTDFMKRYDEYIEKNQKVTEEKENKLKDFYEKNKKVILITGSILIIVGVATTAIIVIRRRSRLI